MFSATEKWSLIKIEKFLLHLTSKGWNDGMMKAEPAGSNWKDIEIGTGKGIWAYGRVVLSAQWKGDSKEKGSRLIRKQTPGNGDEVGSRAAGRKNSHGHLTAFSCGQEFMQAVASIKEVLVKPHRNSYFLLSKDCPPKRLSFGLLILINTMRKGRSSLLSWRKSN